MTKILSTNPAKNYEIVWEVDVSSDKEIQIKVASANKAKLARKALGIQKRIELLRPIYEVFKSKEDELAWLETRETGRAITESKSIIIGHIDKIAWFLDNAEAALADEITHEDDISLHKMVYEPTGVAAVITPWNHPFGMFVRWVMPNLLAGNTVVFKISEECPLMGKLIEDVMVAQQLPEGVFAEVYGAGDIGWKLANQNIDLIWFTWSAKVGEQLYELAGKKFIKAILELWWSNPCIVFEDVAIQDIIKKIYAKKFKINGQTCDALKRLIVHESIFDDVVTALRKEIESKIVGDPEDEKTDIGSLAAKRQLTLLEDQMADALDKWVTVVTWGKKLTDPIGAYYALTLLTNITKNMRIWNEEVFGPVLPVIPFKTEEEAIQLANDTIYGLGSIVFSKDRERAQRVASQINSGTVEINNAIHRLSVNPFGGYKKSWMGREHWVIGFRELCQVKVISQQK